MFIADTPITTLQKQIKIITVAIESTRNLRKTLIARGRKTAEEVDKIINDAEANKKRYERAIKILQFYGFTAPAPLPS